MSAWMQKQQARSSRAAAAAPASSADAAEHASEQRISMYTEAPPGEVCIEDFERFAIDRLRGEISYQIIMAMKSRRLSLEVYIKMSCCRSTKHSQGLR